MGIGHTVSASVVPAKAGTYEHRASKLARGAHNPVSEDMGLRFRGDDRMHAHTGSHENTSPERSSGVNEGPNAPLSCSSSFSGVQPSERCSVRIGRGWLNR